MIIRRSLEIFWTGATLRALLLMFAQILAFAVLWCSQTTFRAMSNPALYVNSLFVAFIMILPYIFYRRKWVWCVVAMLLAIQMEAVLMYYRTYFTAIPLKSYGIVGNLADFLPSVSDSFRLADLNLLLPLTVFCLWRNRRTKQKRFYKHDSILGYVISVICVGLLALVVTTLQGGFMASYSKMKNSCYYSSCTTPVYVIYGDLIFDAITQRSADNPTPEDYEKISNWIERHSELFGDSCRCDNLSQRKSLVVVICESFESWLMENEVEGKVVTPYLNSLVADTSTLYIPNVVTQVGPGRSIDCQLLLNAGLLPMEGDVYSMRFADRKYMTLNQAMHEAHGSRSYILTCDKPVTWNQGLIAQSFKIDSLLDKSDWLNDELVGNPPKLSDRSFLSQVVKKMEKGEIWPVGESAMVQVVTYSGHNPFKLPENLKEITFSEKIPSRLADYMTMARFTDSSLKVFVEYLKSRPDYDDMMVVIIGDHEGLAGYRKELMADSVASKIISPYTLTPFIVLNPPVGGRVSRFVGQVDLYPTLLDLMNLSRYPWRGMGVSALSPSHPGFAITTMTNEIVGDTTNVSADRIRLMQQGRSISDRIIRIDYFKDRF